MAVRAPQRAAARHGGGQPRARGLRRNHGDRTARSSRRRAISGRRLVRGRTAGRSAGLRGRAAAGDCMSLRHWGIAIVGAWVLALGWLVKRGVFRPTGARLAAGALAVAPGGLFYRLKVGDQQIGYLSTTLDTLPSAIRVENVYVLEVPALGKLHRTSSRSVTMLSRALRLQHIDVTFDGDMGQFTTH